MSNQIVSLPSSKLPLFHDDDTIIESTLINLLFEAHKRKLPLRAKIKCVQEHVPEDFPEDVPITREDLEHLRFTETYRSLRRYYKEIKRQDFSPEKEEERARYHLEFLRKQGEKDTAFGIYSAYVRLKKRGEAGVKEAGTFR